MTTRRKAAAARLRITQVHSLIGNQERVKKVVTDGLGLGRIGRSVVLPDDSYTRGMIAKTAHIVTFEELTVADHAAKIKPVKVDIPEAVEKLVEASIGMPEKAPRKKKVAESGAEEKPAKTAATAARKRPPAKNEE